MDDFVRMLYLSGDSAALISIVRLAREQAEDDRDACRALALLARLGDPQAEAFCGGEGASKAVSAQ